MLNKINVEVGDRLSKIIKMQEKDGSELKVSKSINKTVNNRI